MALSRTNIKWTCVIFQIGAPNPKITDTYFNPIFAFRLNRSGANERTSEWKQNNKGKHNLSKYEINDCYVSARTAHTLRRNGNGNKYKDWPPSAALRPNGKIEKFRPFIVDMRAITQTMIDGRSGNLLWLNPSGIFSFFFFVFALFSICTWMSILPGLLAIAERERASDWKNEQSNERV